MMTDPRDFFTLMSDETVTIASVISLNEEAVLVSYSASEVEWEETLPSTNVYIASFVTCHARLRLFEQLEKLGDRACYMDTGTELILIAIENPLVFQTASSTPGSLESTKFLPAATWASGRTKF
jgi:hypothetical protein